MKILFYMDWWLAITYLEPVYQYLKRKEPGWDLFFYSDNSIVRNKLDGKGYPFKMDNYDYAFVCDGQSACYPSSGKKICTFHGLASKGAELSLKRAKAYQGFNGYFIAPSNYYKDLLINKMGVGEDKIILGGLMKFDTVEQISPLRSNPQILFAPTHNVELTAICVLYDFVYQLDNIKIHLHNYTREGDHPLHKMFQGLYSDNLVDVEDITQSLLDSDIVIADMGSTVLEAMALGKFTIQVVNPLYEQFYRNRGISVEERDGLPEIELPKKYAYQAKSIEEVKRIIEQYPKSSNSTFSIVENIGNFQVSKIIHEFIVG